MASCNNAAKAGKPKPLLAGKPAGEGKHFASMKEAKGWIVAGVTILPDK